MIPRHDGLHINAKINMLDQDMKKRNEDYKTYCDLWRFPGPRITSSISFLEGNNQILS